MQQVQEFVNARVDDRLSDQRERTVAYGTRRLGEALGYLMMEAIMQAISGHQWSSVAISGHQWSSVAISGHQWPSVVALTWMRASVSESTEEVASSMITIAGRVSSARAMHNSWRCPADKFAPSSSTCSSSV